MSTNTDFVKREETTKIEIITETINKLSREQLCDLMDYIQYNYAEENIDSQIANARKQIYTIYENGIAPIIDKIEVYDHRFPVDAYSGVEAMFRHMASFETISLEDEPRKFSVGCVVSEQSCSKDDLLKNYKTLAEYANYIACKLSIQLIRLYIRRIVCYKSLLSKFDYEGECPDFKKHIASRLKIVRKNLKLGSKLPKKCHKQADNMIYEFYVTNVDTSEEQKALKTALTEAERLIEYCENNYSSIIRCGYSNSFWNKMFNLATVIIPIIISIIGIAMLVSINK